MHEQTKYLCSKEKKTDFLVAKTVHINCVHKLCTKTVHIKANVT